MIEQYIAGQIEHHPMADPGVQERLHGYQINNPEVDLSAARQNAHAIYWYNLQVCFAMMVAGGKSGTTCLWGCAI